MGYVITCSDNKRARVVNNGIAELTPYFEYPEQAMKYITKHLNGSSAVQIHKVEDKNTMLTDEEWLIRKLETYLKATPSKAKLLNQVIEFVHVLGNYNQGGDVNDN